MMRPKITVLRNCILLLSLLTFSSNLRAANMREGKVTRSGREIKVPQGLVKELEQWYVKTQRRFKPDDVASDAEVLGHLKRQMLDLEIILRPKSSAAVAEPVRYRLPTGGGWLDLADAVTGSRGGFWVKMNLINEPEGSDLRVFYVSGARARSLSDANYGAGCDKWAEITTWFKTIHRHKDLDAYATNHRHVSVLAGSWIFAAVREQELWLAAVVLEDSRNTHVQCASAL